MTGRGVEWVRLWDGRQWPGRVVNGVPEFGWKQAPGGLSTRRQLRDKGLAPGGQEPFGRLAWKRGTRHAALYIDAKAKPKRVATPAQLAAVDKALAARKVCTECGPVDHFVRTTDRLCGDCHAAGVEPTAGGTSSWRTVQDWQASDDEASSHDRAGEAAIRAVAALTRAASQVEAAEQRADEREEELARWHADDTARLVHVEPDRTWNERGVA